VIEEYIRNQLQDDIVAEQLPFIRVCRSIYRRRSEKKRRKK